MKKIALSLILITSIQYLYSQVIPTKGKEFWVGFMQNYVADFENQRLDIFIASDQNTSGIVTIPNTGYSQSFNVIANVTTTVNIPNDLAEHFSSQVIENMAVLVETLDTVSVFAINFKGYTADATKILPIQSIGIDYRISSYDGLGGGYESEFLIVSTEDSTEVEITPVVTTLEGNPAGVPFTVTLDRGETYQVKAQDGVADLTGSTIIGTEASGPCRPFAVFSGTICVNIPDPSCGACDHIYEQNFPVKTWGKDFYVVPFSFATSYTYRVMANEDNTQVTIDGGAPYTLNAGEYEDYNYEPDAVCVSANKGISVTQYMQGISCSGNGDPAMLILNDASQKIDNVTFSTVSSAVITDHGLNIIMATENVGELTLDGLLVPVSAFEPFPNCPENSFAQIDIAEGSHTLDAASGFTAYVYGAGSAESYAYSVGSFNPAEPIQVDTAFCSNNQITIFTDGQNYSSIYWYAQNNPDTILGYGETLILNPPIVTDIYVAVGADLFSGCEEEHFFSVESPDPLNVTAEPDSSTVCRFQPLQLNGSVNPNSGLFFYSWSPQDGLDNPNAQNPIATPSQSTTYVLTVTTTSGCASGTDSVYIEVNPGNIISYDVQASDEIICAGDEIDLNAVVELVTFEEDFDPGIDAPLWAEINLATATSDCGSVSGNALYFNGTGNRKATTIGLDVSNGGTVKFSLKIGHETFPCDNTEPGDNIVLEYSTTGLGGVFYNIATYFEAGYSQFNTISVPIPAAAQTTSTMFRWRQLANSGVNTDNWAIDNVYIGAITDAPYTFNWTPAAEISDPTIQNPTATPTTETLFFVESVDGFSGCTYKDSLLISVGQPFEIDVTPDTSTCSIAGISLQAIPDGTDFYSYLWTPNDGTLNNENSPTPTATPYNTTDYGVTVTSNYGCVATGEVTITVGQIINIYAYADNYYLCYEQSTNIYAYSDFIGDEIVYTWTPGATLEDSTSLNTVATPLEDITYTITASDTASGCVVTAELDIVVYDDFNIDIGNDTLLCTVQGFQINGTDDTSDPLYWNWSPYEYLDNAYIPNPIIIDNNEHEFIATAYNNAGCSVSDTITVSILFSQPIDIGDDADICQGDSIVISTGYDEGFTNIWSTGDTTAELVVTATGIYSVNLVSDQGCETNDEISITVHALPVVNLGEDVTLCDGQTITLNAGNAGSDFLWNTSAVSQTLEVSTADNYSVEVTNSWNCVNDDEILIFYNETPVVDLPVSVSICEDEEAVLDAGNSNNTILWSNGAESSVVSVNNPGIYTVTVTTDLNCSATDQTEVIVYTYPIVNLSIDEVFCEGATYVLDAENPALDHIWSTGDTSQTIEVTENETYSVTVDNNYCFTTESIDVNFYPLPIRTLLPEYFFCADFPLPYIELDAGNPGFYYQWNNGDATQTSQIYNEGPITVIITSVDGCSIVDSTIVTEICFGDNLFMPNSFTPNGDGVNDLFKAVGTNITDFHLMIFNRWGELIFETYDINQAWQGNSTSGGYYAQNELYPYQVNYKYIANQYGQESQFTTKKGTITVIR